MSGAGVVDVGCAQDLRRLEVTASAGIRGPDGMWLPGTNPDEGSATAGCLVQVLSVGSNGIAEPPAANGEPSGDDVVVGTTVIGKGIAPNLLLSGRFAASFYPPRL